MKVINKIILLALGLMVPMAACDTDELHDRNINPQALQTAPMEFLFTAAQLGSAAGGSAGDNRYIDWRTNIGLCAYAIQQLLPLPLAVFLQVINISTMLNRITLPGSLSMAIS